MSKEEHLHLTEGSHQTNFIYKERLCIHTPNMLMLSGQGLSVK